MTASVPSPTPRPYRVPIPPTRGPFVNAKLIPLGPGPDGVDRFWTSTWNAVSGSTGLLVTADGATRTYRFDPPHSGFYSAVPADATTLWLCGDLSRMVRLDLVSGTYESFPTGAPEALVFPGMALDPATGKILCAAYPPEGTTGIVFDTGTCRTVTLLPNLTDELYQCASFPSPDGSWTVLVYNPDVTLLEWDPGTDEISTTRLSELWPEMPRPYDTRDLLGRLIRDDRGRVHLPGAGWYDPMFRRLTGGPRPERELAWFARRGRTAWGVRREGDVAVVARWDMDGESGGAVRDLCEIPDSTAESVELTSSGDIVAVSVYGDFYRYRGDDGKQVMMRATETAASGEVDCLHVVGGRLFGTTFITQRFWQVDLHTGAGTDLGRAAPGTGEVLQTWDVDGVLYMAAYTTGALTRFDPREPAVYGENPRLLLEPAGAMRPVAAADDGRRLFYASTHHYGHLGCVLARYDTTTGDSWVVDDPLPLLAVTSLCLEPTTGLLAAGSTIEADCGSARPQASRAAVAVIDPETLAVLAHVALPEGVGSCHVVGPYRPGSVVVRAEAPGDDSGRDRWFVVDVTDPCVPEASRWRPLPDDTSQVIGTDVPGQVVLRRTAPVGAEAAADGRSGLPATDGFELWDLDGPNGPAALGVLLVEPAARRAQVHGRDLLASTAHEAIVLRDVLTGASAAPA